MSFDANYADATAAVQALENAGITVTEVSVDVTGWDISVSPADDVSPAGIGGGTVKSA